MPRACLMSSSRLRIWPRIDTSAPDSGSSAMIEARSGSQRARNRQPLALAAGELMGKARQVLGAGPQPDAVEQLDRAQLGGAHRARPGPAAGARARCGAD